LNRSLDRTGRTARRHAIVHHQPLDPCPNQHRVAGHGTSARHALGLWICLAAVLGTTTILGLSLLAPDWDPTIGPTVVVVAEVYGALAATLVLVCGGWTGLRERLAFRFTSWQDIGLSVALFGVWVASSVACYSVLALALGWSARHT
jgi:hypothetical protein